MRNFVYYSEFNSTAARSAVEFDGPSLPVRSLRLKLQSSLSDTPTADADLEIRDFTSKRVYLPHESIAPNTTVEIRRLSRGTAGLSQMQRGQLNSAQMTGYLMRTKGAALGDLVRDAVESASGTADEAALLRSVEADGSGGGGRPSILVGVPRRQFAAAGARKPPPHYVCRICEQKGDHFSQQCPLMTGGPAEGSSASQPKILSLPTMTFNRCKNEYRVVQTPASAPDVVVFRLPQEFTRRMGGEYVVRKVFGGSNFVSAEKPIAEAGPAVELPEELCCLLCKKPSTAPQEVKCRACKASRPACERCAEKALQADALKCPVCAKGLGPRSVMTLSSELMARIQAAANRPSQKELGDANPEPTTENPHVSSSVTPPIDSLEVDPRRFEKDDKTSLLTPASPQPAVSLPQSDKALSRVILPGTILGSSLGKRKERTSPTVVTS